MPELPSVSQLPQPGGDSDSDMLEQFDGVSTRLVNWSTGQLVNWSMASTVNYPCLLPRPGSPSPLGD